MANTFRSYIALVHKDEDSSFGVQFPDVPGCFSAADDEADLVRNAIEALSLHLEDSDLPPARGIDAAAHDEDVAAELRKGAYLVQIPFVRSARRVRRVNLSIEDGVLRAIDAAANARGLTRSAFIAEASLNELHRSQ